MGIAQDITDRKNLEQQFRQAQKMEAVGRLSGGIAHDFNNILSIIIGHSDILDTALEPTDKLHKSAKQIKEAGMRGASLTRQLLAFSRQQVLEPKVLSLNAVVSDTEKMLRCLIGEDVELQTVLEPRLGNIKADQGQIEQVIINLAVNSRDAMPRGGTLTIKTANLDVDEAGRKYGYISPGCYVALTVSDTGIGMDADTKSRIFEPFFTTKERGKGTGLGLSMAYGVVKQSGGFIWVESEPGLGATFTILLPRVGEAVQPPSETNSQLCLSRGETILVVEDDVPLRHLLMYLLSKNGYKMLEAADAREALNIARQRARGEIDLLLTDVVMPRISGPQLADELIAIHPSVKLLFMSGYTEFAADHDRISRDGTHFLQKPFTELDLTRKIREVLEMRPQSSSELCNS